MKKTLTIILALAIAFSTMAFLPQPVFAETGGGSGTLTADGAGHAGVTGEGTINISGNGILYFKDNTGDASIEIDGRGTRRVLANGWVRYLGFRGDAVITGSDVAVKITGVRIHLEASGTGKFFVRGHGTYATGSQSGSWTLRLQAIPLD